MLMALHLAMYFGARHFWNLSAKLEMTRFCSRIMIDFVFEASLVPARTIQRKFILSTDKLAPI